MGRLTVCRADSTGADQAFFAKDLQESAISPRWRGVTLQSSAKSAGNTKPVQIPVLSEISRPCWR